MSDEATHLSDTKHPSDKNYRRMLFIALISVQWKRVWKRVRKSYYNKKQVIDNKPADV